MSNTFEENEREIYASHLFAQQVVQMENDWSPGNTDWITLVYCTNGMETVNEEIQEICKR